MYQTEMDSYYSTVQQPETMMSNHQGNPLFPGVEVAARYEPEIESYQTVQQPEPMMSNHQGEYHQQSGWLPPKSEVMHSSQVGMNLPQQGGMNLPHQGGMNSNQESDMNLRHQGGMDVYQQNGRNLPQQGGMNSTQRSDMNLRHQGGMDVYQQNGRNLPQQGGMNLPPQGGMIVSHQSGMNSTRQSDMNLHHQGGMDVYQQNSRNLPQQGGMNLPPQGSMTLSHQSGMDSTQQSDLNLHHQGGMDVYQQGGRNLPQQGGMNLSQQGGMGLRHQGGMNVPPPGCMNVPPPGGMNVPPPGGMNVPHQGSMNFPQQSGTNVPQQGCMKFPKQSGIHVTHSSSMDMSMSSVPRGDTHSTSHMSHTARLPQQPRGDTHSTSHMSHSAGSPQQPRGDTYSTSHMSRSTGLPQQPRGDTHSTSHMSHSAGLPQQPRGDTHSTSHMSRSAGLPQQSRGDTHSTSHMSHSAGLPQQPRGDTHSTSHMSHSAGLPQQPRGDTHSTSHMSHSAGLPQQPRGDTHRTSHMSHTHSAGLPQQPRGDTHSHSTSHMKHSTGLPQQPRGDTHSTSHMSHGAGLPQQPRGDTHNTSHMSHSAGLPQQPRGDTHSRSHMSHSAGLPQQPRGDTHSTSHMSHSAGLPQQPKTMPGGFDPGPDPGVDTFYASTPNTWHTDVTQQCGTSTYDPQDTSDSFHHGGPPQGGSGFLEGDRQSSVVSSSDQTTGSESTELQRNIGAKLLAISSQMARQGKSSLGKGSMGNAVKQTLRAPEPDSSSSMQRQDEGGGGLSGNKELSSKFADEDTEYCKLCNVYFTSAPLYAFHVRGLTHVQRLLAVEADLDRQPAETPFTVSGANCTQAVSGEGVPRGPWTKKVLDKSAEAVTMEASGAVVKETFCDVCALPMREADLWHHMSGKKHWKALKQRKKQKERQAKRAEDQQNMLVDPTTVIEESDFGLDFENTPSDSPIVGLGYVEELPVPRQGMYSCTLCQKNGNRRIMARHIKCYGHKLAYIQTDEEMAAQVRNRDSKLKRPELVRQLCMELEKRDGRGQPMYYGPPRKKKPKTEKNHRSPGRDVTPALPQEQDEDMGASEEEQQRGSLLLEFERQLLPYEEAEQRVQHRVQLVQTYQQRGLPSEEARRQVLEDEVLRDFENEFQRLGLRPDQAKKMAEKRLWMLETLHRRGLSPEEAGQRVMELEEELKRSLGAWQEREGGRGSRNARWTRVRGKLRNYVEHSGLVLGLSADQIQAQLRLILECLDTYKEKNLKPEEARYRVLVDDLATLPDIAQASPLEHAPEPQTDPLELEPEPQTNPLKHEPEPQTNPLEHAPEPSLDLDSEADIAHRLKQFKSKLAGCMEAAAASPKQGKPAPGGADTEKQGTVTELEFDQHCLLEIQSMLSDQLKRKVPADEALKSVRVLHNQHERLRFSLFPSEKSVSSSRAGTGSTSKDPQVSSTKSNQPASSKQQASNQLSTQSHSDTETKKASASSKEMKNSEGETSKTKESSSTKESSETIEPTEKSNNEKNSSKLNIVKKPSKEKSNQESSGCKEESKRCKLSKEEKERRSIARRGKAVYPKHCESSGSKPKDKRWNTSLNIFNQLYGLKKAEVHTQVDDQHSANRNRSRSPGRSQFRRSPRRENPRSRSRSRHGSRNWEGGRGRLRSLSTSRSRRSRFRPASRSPSRSGFRLASRSPSRSRLAGHWHSPSPQFRSRLQSIERELYCSPDMSGMSPPPHDRYSPERGRDWIPQSPGPWFAERGRHGLPDRQPGSNRRHGDFDRSNRRLGDFDVSYHTHEDFDRSNRNHRDFDRSNRSHGEFDRHPPRSFDPNHGHGPRRHHTPSPNRFPSPARSEHERHPGHRSERPNRRDGRGQQSRFQGGARADEEDVNLDIYKDY